METRVRGETVSMLFLKPVGLHNLITVRGGREKYPQMVAGLSTEILSEVQETLLF